MNGEVLFYGAIVLGVLAYGVWRAHRGAEGSGEVPMATSWASDDSSTGACAAEDAGQGHEDTDTDSDSGGSED